MIRFRLPWTALGAGAVILSAPLGRAEAQRRPEPQLLLTIMGGATTGATLYSGLRQALPLIEDPLSIDTIELGRRLPPGILLGASATYFPSPNIGLTGEISYIGFDRDDGCALVYVDPSSARVGWNEQTCNNIAAMTGSASTIAFDVGGMYRFFPRGGVKPYLLAHVGLTTRASSTVEVTGSFVDGDGVTRQRLIIQDPSPSSVDPSGVLGVGVMLPFAAGYQARLEFRDRVMFVDRVTGAANALGQAPTERILIHSVGLVFMLDIVLEQRRGRRY
jgi:hypothetical protein